METTTKDIKDIELTLSGRVFRKARTTTIDQDAYVMKRMREFGLVEMASTFDPVKDELDDFSQQLLMAAFETGKLYEVLAGVLIEEGVVWSRAVAKQNAEFFATLTDKDDKAQLFSSIASVLVDFLVYAAVWSKTSLKSFGNPNGGINPSELTEALQNLTSESGTSSSGS